MIGLARKIGVAAVLILGAGCGDQAGTKPSAAASGVTAENSAAAGESQSSAIDPVLAKIREAANGVQEYTCSVTNVYKPPSTATKYAGKSFVSVQGIAFKRPDKFFIQEDTQTSIFPNGAGEQRQTVMNGAMLWQLWIQRSGPAANKLNIGKTDLTRLKQAGIETVRFFPPTHLADPWLMFEETTAQLVEENEREWIVEASSKIVMEGVEGGPTQKVRMTFDRSTGLLQKVIINGADTDGYNPNHSSREMTVSQTRVNPNPTIEERFFVYSPPPGAEGTVRDSTEETIRAMSPQG